MSYPDCYNVMDQALADPVGVRIPMKTIDDAQFFRSRCHQARKLNRQANARVYPDTDHPLHGHSEYDQLVLKIRRFEDEVFLYVERIPEAVGGVEPLSGVTEAAVKDIPVPAEVQRVLDEFVRRV
jgi:hypothetical protein